MRIILIAAVGKSGQIGLNGDIPWAHHAEDMKHFRHTTTNSILIVGHNTWPSVKQLDGTRGRKILVDQSTIPHDYVRKTYSIANAKDVAKFHRSNLYIAGGAKTYLRWMNDITEMLISHIDYDGPADTYFPEEFDQLMIPRRDIYHY